MTFSWRAMDAFYEEDERIVGHTADSHHRIDIGQTSRHLIVRHAERVIADSTGPLVLYESGFAPRWYVPRGDVDQGALTPVEGQTFCPCKGLGRSHDIGEIRRAVWCYEHAWEEVKRISDLVSFEPDKVSVQIVGRRIGLQPRQNVISHGMDRDLAVEEVQVCIGDGYRIGEAKFESTKPRVTCFRVANEEWRRVVTQESSAHRCLQRAPQTHDRNRRD